MFVFAEHHFAVSTLSDHSFNLVFGQTVVSVEILSSREIDSVFVLQVFKLLLASHFCAELIKNSELFDAPSIQQ